MKDIEEVVDLPPVESKPLLHPMDVAPARKPYLASWWLGRVASLPVAFLFGVVLWVISNNMITPILAPLITLTIAVFAEKHFSAEAWAFIPRKRHDHARDQQLAPQLAVALIDTIALVSALLVLIAWLSAQGVDSGVAAFSVGAGAGIAILQIAELIATAVRRPRDGAVLGSRVLVLAAVVTVVLMASVTLIGDAWDSGAALIASMGGATMIAIQVVWWLIRLMPSRRTATRHVRGGDRHSA